MTPFSARNTAAILMVCAAFACSDDKSGECSVDMDCPGTQMCVDGECRPRGCPQIPCEEGLVCVQGACYLKDCELTACGTDFVCVDDECIHTSCVGVVCTPPDECVDGECVSDPCIGLDCEDNNSCTDDTCLAGQCQHLPVADGTQCGSTSCDGLLWQIQTCQAGACTGSQTQQDCDDGNICTNDSCAPDTGCQNLPLPAGSDCGLCSACDAAGSCIEDLTSDECPACQQCGPGGTCVPMANHVFCDGDTLTLCDGSGNIGSTEICPLGCNPAADPDRCYQLDPSNLDPTLLCEGSHDLEITEPAVIDTDQGTITGLDPADTTFTVVAQGPDAPEIAVFSFNTIDLQADLNVNGTRALALLSCHDIVINGIITACGKNRLQGPGGWSGGTTEQDGDGYENGYGKLGPGNDILDQQAGAGGGGYGGTGGQGGDYFYGTAELIGGQGGTSYGAEELVPLLGGSGGGGGAHLDNQHGGYGGGGGGAVQIVAGGALSIPNGSGVNACGAAGMVPRDLWGSGGGGGAGGGILLEAAEITVEGILAANGGGGGGGGGGQYIPPDYPGDGEDGTFGTTPAAGGPPGIHGRGASGGPGGAGTACGGGDSFGDQDDLGGGGGGACGRIRLNTLSGSAFMPSGETSPDQSTGLFTQGQISVY